MLKCFQIIVNTHNLDMGDPKKGNANIKAIWYILVRICTISIGGGDSRDVYTRKGDMLGMDPMWLKWSSCHTQVIALPLVGISFS